MNRKVKTRILSLVCIVCLLASILSPVFQTKAEESLERLDPTLEQITFSDFGVNGKYENNTEEHAEYFGSYDGNLSGKVISGDVTFSTRESHLKVGGYPGALYGLDLYSDGNHLYLTIPGQTPIELDSNTAGTTLVGVSFNLKLSYQEVDDVDNSGKKLQLGVWFNDKLYNNEYFYVTTYTHEDDRLEDRNRTYTDLLRGEMMLFVKNRGGCITLESEAPEEPEILDSSLKQITFRDFGFNQTEYTKNPDPDSDGVHSGEYADGLSGKVFSGTITFSEQESYLMVGGYTTPWYGLYLATAQDGVAADCLQLTLAGKKYVLNPTTAGVALVGNPFNLKLSYQELDTNEDEEKDTLQLGIWFNNKLYNNRYFYVSTYIHDKAEYGTRPYTDFLRGGMYLFPSKGVITIASEAEPTLETLDPTLEQITFRDFEFDNGIYEFNPDPATDGEHNGSYDGSLSGKVISGDITFAKRESHLKVGGYPNAWYGLDLFSDGGEILYLNIAGQSYELDSTTAGTTLVGESFNLKLSYQEIDRDGYEGSDTLKLGVWFEDKLYNNEYIYVSNYTHEDETLENRNRDYTDFLRGDMILFPKNNGGSITLVSEAVEEDEENKETLNPTLEKITFSNFGFESKAYKNDTEEHAEYFGSYDGNLSGKVISGDVTFSTRESHLKVGGYPGALYGLDLFSDGNALYLTIPGQTPIELNSKTAGTTLVGASFNLKLSYQEVDDVDNGGKKLQLGVWFNDKLYNNEYFYVTTYTHEDDRLEDRNRTYTDLLRGEMMLFVKSGGGCITLESEAVEEEEKETLDPTLEQITFRDFGFANDKYINNDPKEAAEHLGNYAGSLSCKVISGDVTFSKREAHLKVGGYPNAWYGLDLFTDGNENLYLNFAGQSYVLDSKTAGTTLVDKSFNLKLSYQEVDDGNGGKKLQLGVWFDDTLYDNKYFYVEEYTHEDEGNRTYKDLLGIDDEAGMILFLKSNGGGVTLASDYLEQLDPTLQKVTFKDFNIEDGTYVYKKGKSTAGTYKGTLSGKVFSGDIKFSAKESRFYIGGYPDASQGFSLVSGKKEVPSDCLQMTFGNDTYVLSPQIAHTTLVGVSLNLKLSYQEVDKDGDGKADTLRLGVWFEDRLYRDNYFELSTYAHTEGQRNYKDYLTGNMYLQPAVAGSSLEIASDIPKELDPTLEQLTFNDFGVEDGTYKQTGDFSAIGRYNGSLSGKVFSGEVKFSSTGANYFYMAGYPEGYGWTGLYLATGMENVPSDCLQLSLGNQTYTLRPGVAGTALVGASYNLKLSYQEVDRDKDGKNDSLQLGVWFDDKLYDNQYFYISTYKHSEYGTRDYTDFLTGGLYLFPRSEKSTITVASDYLEQLDSSLTKVTFKDFGIADGIYAYQSGKAVSGEYSGTLSGTVFSGDIRFTKKQARFYIGGYPDAKQGLSLASGKKGVPADSLELTFGGKKYILAPQIAHVTLVGETFNLKLSYQEVDTDQDKKNDTLKLGIWFNNKLYKNEYFYLSTYKHAEQQYGTRGYADYLVGEMRLYPAVKGASLKIASDVIQTLDPDMEQITFSNFKLEDGIYKYNDGDVAASGKFAEGLAGKILNGNVTFSSKATYLMIGGYQTPWYGLSIGSGLEGTPEGCLRLEIAGQSYVLRPEIAGATLVEKPFNLKLSYQEIDKNEDGTNDTLKLGVWINNKLYDNTYIQVSTYENAKYGARDYTDFFAGMIYIFPRSEKGYLKIASKIDPLANPALGSVRSRSPYTGDTVHWAVYVCMMALAGAAIYGSLHYTIVKKRKHTKQTI